MKKLVLALALVGIVLGGCSRKVVYTIPVTSYNSTKDQTAAQFVRKYIDAYVYEDYQNIVVAQNIVYQNLDSQEKQDLRYNLANGVAKFKTAVAAHGGLAKILTEKDSTKDGITKVDVTFTYRDNQADTFSVNVAKKHGRWIVIK